MLKLAADLVALFFIFSSVNYPSVEHFVSYLSISVLSCTVLTSTYCILSYFVTADPGLIVNPMYGFGGVMVSILMYARQFRGAESVLPASPIPVSFHNLPVLLLLAELGLRLAGFGRFAKDLPFVVISMVLSWSYLRFYARGPVSSAALVCAYSDAVLSPRVLYLDW